MISWLLKKPTDAGYTLFLIVSYCFKGVSGIFFGCLRGRYKAPVAMANAYTFSQFEPKNSQSEGHFYVNQYSLQIAFIFNGLLIKIKHMIRNKSDSIQFKRPCLRKYYKNE